MVFRWMRLLIRQDGFSLTEVLVVIVIIGILVLLAMPRFSAVITRAKTMEAKTMLKHLHTLQEAYYYEHDVYARELAEVGFEQAILVSEGGEARYRIDIVQANSQGFIARAVAVVDFDRDGKYNVWEIDQKGIVRQTVQD